MASEKMLASGEIKLLEQLYSKEYLSMLKISKSALINPQQSEDAIQGAFLDAMQNFNKFSSSENPMGWLYIALRFQISHINRGCIKEAKLKAKFGQQVVDFSYEPNKATIFDIPDIQSNVELLSRFYIEGHTIKELAQKDGCSVGAMKMRLKRAREGVVKFLTENPE